jgi:hypothetical protein
MLIEGELGKSECWAISLGGLLLASLLAGLVVKLLVPRPSHTVSVFSHSQRLHHQILPRMRLCGASPCVLQVMLLHCLWFKGVMRQTVSGLKAGMLM